MLKYVIPAVEPELRAQAVFSLSEYATDTGVWPRVGSAFPTRLGCVGSRPSIVKREKVSSPALTVKMYCTLSVAKLEVTKWLHRWIYIAIYDDGVLTDGNQTS